MGKHVNLSSRKCLGPIYCDSYDKYVREAGGKSPCTSAGECPQCRGLLYLVYGGPGQPTSSVHAVILPVACYPDRSPPFSEPETMNTSPPGNRTDVFRSSYNASSSLVTATPRSTFIPARLHILTEERHLQVLPITFFLLHFVRNQGYVRSNLSLYVIHAFR